MSKRTERLYTDAKRSLDVSDRGTLTALTFLAIAFWPVTVAVLAGALVWSGIKRMIRR